VDDEGRRASIVLKAAKSGALISDMEREWEAGVRVGTLAAPNGDPRGFMKTGLPFHTYLTGRRTAASMCPC